MLNRYKIVIEYDGTDFVGWQKQKRGISIQESIEQAIYKFCNQDVTVHGAGRTDAGVHAYGQVAHFDINKKFSDRDVKQAISYHLKPKNITIVEALSVGVDFHARFSALKRSYIYKIINRNSPLIIDKNRAWHVAQKLNVNAMRIATTHLIGCHDFSSFRSAHCQAQSPIRTIDQIEIIEEGCNISILISAPSFLQNQIRIIVGTLVNIGLTKWSPDRMLKILDLKNRCVSGPTAPPSGLYFLEVTY